MPEALNVLYCVPIGGWGGVERFLRDVLLRHDPRRVRPSVLAFSDGAWLRELTERGVNVHCVEDMRFRRPLRAFRAVSDILKKEHIGLVHAAYPWCHALSAPAATWNRCRQIWFHHGPMSRSRWQGAMPLIPADLVLVNSDFLRRRLQHTLYIAKRTEVLHYGIDVESFRPDAGKRQQCREQWGLDPKATAVGLVGFIDPWKGQDIFLEAALRLRGVVPGLRMFVIGGPRAGQAENTCRAFESELKAFVARHRLEDVVSFTGHVDVRQGALDGLDIFVHASTEPEPFGMVLLEAMAKRKAIIASAEGGPVEILTERADAMLVAPGNPELLAERIRTLVEDGGLRDTLGQRAQQTVAERFSAERATRQLECAYETVMQ